jgi:hypothetical protein
MQIRKQQLQLQNTAGSLTRQATNAMQEQHWSVRAA